MSLFFVLPENVDEVKSIITISGEEARHIAKSLRHKENDEIFIADGIRNKYHVRIKKITNNSIICEIIDKNKGPLKHSSLKITLAQAILKKNKMDFVIQKATELGIHDIIPFTSSRTIPIIGKNNIEKKRERWQKIAYEASKQSERMHIPKIHTIISLNDLLKQSNHYDLSIVFWEKENSLNLKELLQRETNHNKIVYFIGPEGGFSKDEIDKAEKENALPVSMGKTIIKSETASIFAISVFNYHYFTK